MTPEIELEDVRVTDDLDTILEYLATELLGWTFGPCKKYVNDGWHMPDGYEVPHIPHTPHPLRRFLLTGNGMLKLIEAMREPQYYRYVNIVGNGAWSVAFHRYGSAPNDRTWHATSESLPEAVARACYSAHAAEKEHQRKARKAARK